MYICRYVHFVTFIQDQYMYVHDAINDHVTCGDSIIVAHELGQKITEMSTPDPQTGLTGYGKHFQVRH